MAAISCARERPHPMPKQLLSFGRHQPGLAALAQGGKLNDPAVLPACNKTSRKTTPLIRKARTGVFTEDELLPGDGILRTEI